MDKTKLETKSVNTLQWLSIDRKWNIFFHISMSIAVGFGWYFITDLDCTKLGVFIILGSLIIIPKIFVHFNGIKYERKDRIFNRQGQLLGKNRMPYEGASSLYAIANFFALWLPSWFGSSPSILYFFIIFSLFCSYFIYIDCPITYVFDHNTQNFGKSDQSNAAQKKKSHDDFYNRQRTNPAYSNFANNVWHRSPTNNNNHRRHR